MITRAAHGRVAASRERIATLTAVRPRALLIDWVGVLTSDFATAVRSWTRSENLDHQTFMDAMVELRDAGYREQAGSGMVRALECGEIGPDAFERALAARMRDGSGTAPNPTGLIQRLFGHLRVDMELLALVRRVRTRGYRTALLSNSWGNEYPRELWDGAFDHALISSELGMRKPQPDIYLHAASLLGVAPHEVVFVDDMPDNVAGAIEVGMVGVLHENPIDTARILNDRFAAVTEECRRAD